MTSLEAAGLSKKFVRSNIITNFSYTFQSGKRYAITGHNGSGKSTLLKLLCGSLSPSKGYVYWHKGDKKVEVSECHHVFSYCSPHLDLYDTFTFLEMVGWLNKFRKFSVEKNEWQDILEWPAINVHKKELKSFSSGMQQKAKLAIAFYMESYCLMLDEPLSNLDETNSNWYHKHLQQVDAEKTLLIATNRMDEECPKANNVIDLNLK